MKLEKAYIQRTFFFQEEKYSIFNYERKRKKPKLLCTVKKST